jgi:hypothetical protein
MEVHGEAAQPFPRFSNESRVWPLGEFGIYQRPEPLLHGVNEAPSLNSPFVRLTAKHPTKTDQPG